MGEFIFSFICVILWVVSIVHDAAANNIAWVIVDVFLFPIAVFRGIYLIATGVL